MNNISLIDKITKIKLTIKIKKRICLRDKYFGLCSTFGRRLSSIIRTDDNSPKPNIGYFDIYLILKGHEYALSFDLDNNL